MTVEAQQTRVSRDASPEFEQIHEALGGAEAYLRSLQNEDGHWCGELEGDSILESEYALTLVFLGRHSDAKFRRLAMHLRSQQLEDGGWANFPGGPSGD